MGQQVNIWSKRRENDLSENKEHYLFHIFVPIPLPHHVLSPTHVVWVVGRWLREGGKRTVEGRFIIPTQEEGVAQLQGPIHPHSGSSKRETRFFQTALVVYVWRWKEKGGRKKFHRIGI